MSLVDRIPQELLPELHNLAPRTGASMNRGNSKQDYETPDDFIAAVVKRFGRLSVDLAATADNRKCDCYVWSWKV